MGTNVSNGAQVPQESNVIVAKGKAQKPSRKPDYFSRVNSKYSNLLRVQVGNADKRKVFDASIKQFDEIDDKSYRTKMYDTISKFAYNLSYLMECKDYNLDAVSTFNVAQNVTLLGMQTKVQKRGLKAALKSSLNVDLEMLTDSVFSEEELATAKFETPASSVSNSQKTQLSDLIGKAMSILPDNNNSAE